MNQGLLLLSGDEKGARYRIDAGRHCSIGRDPASTICLKDRSVSKHHAVIEVIDGQLRVKDLGTINGTFVNGCKVSDRILNLTDNLSIGPAVFRVITMEAGAVAGDSVVSMAAGGPVIQMPTPAPADADDEVTSVAECVRGMQEIMARHSNDIVRESLKFVFRLVPVTRIAVFNVPPGGRITQGYTVYRRAGDNPVNLSRSFAEKVLAAKKSLLIKDAEEVNSRTLQGSVGFRDVHSIVGLPIVIHGRAVAVLLGDNLEKPNILNEEHLRMFQFAGKAIEVLYQRDAIGKLESMVNFLPVCDLCKRIRDDQGYWNQLEEFVSERAAVRLSKSCCPECAGKVIRS